MRSTLALLQRLSHKRGTRRKRRSVERGSSLRWSKVRSIDRDKAKVSIRLFRARLFYLCQKNPGAIVSKNHTREKVQFGKQHYQGERGPCARVVLLLPHHIEERETKTALCEIMCCACCVVLCSSVLSRLFLLICESINRIPTPVLPDPPWHFTSPARSISN